MKTTVNEDFERYNTVNIKLVTNTLENLSNKVDTIRYTEGVVVPKHPDTSKPMWLVTDKDGSSQIIMCSDKPFRNLDSWAPGNGDYLQAYVDSPFSAKFFGIFWKKAAEELRKIGLPKWEDDPVEIEVSRIKINYY